jgi:transcription antitermination protein NusB
MTCGVHRAAAAGAGGADGKSLSRRQSRRKAFELLFELEQHPGLTVDGILLRTFNDPDVLAACATDEDGEGYVSGPLDDSARLFITELLHAVHDHTAEIDAELAKYPHDWSYERIGVPERVLLKLALAEMVYLGTSYKVVINEALDLAKLYAQEEARRFINGILGAVVKQLDELKSAQRPDATAAADPAADEELST